ncbi:hypothetical protein NEA10_17980 [Phormidium yuhuli AB48]|uniref:Uncharacterized protein n=1 Tax=Phormidium yuhuli AB48 TaxID=2940671 RepID=A0ABY5AQQ0_9CYAN|nr:hypothetical protein [Phormidium yuhuli]USR90686.1 hypothetical protein NEA10_17980 [Phormidium yuhuli AB48]
MSSTPDKPNKDGLTAWLSTPNLVLLSVMWGVVALLFFLLFSVTIPGEGRPFWYGIGTLLSEQIAFTFAAALCLRNGFSSKIASGRNVWLFLGFGMVSFFIGNLFFSWWELYWELDPAVSPGDLFYVGSYFCMTIGMILAVRSRRLNLELWQWGVILAIATVGVAFAAWVSHPFEFGLDASNAIADGAVTIETARPAPDWVITLEKQLDPFGPPLNLLYVVLDVLLLIIAAILLLAFWGGRFSQSWRMIAAAAFSQYVADMWFKYADKNIPNYESGDLLEVFFTFTGVFFAIGALLEYDVSTRAVSRSRRRRGPSS